MQNITIYLLIYNYDREQDVIQTAALQKAKVKQSLPPKAVKGLPLLEPPTFKLWSRLTWSCISDIVYSKSLQAHDEIKRTVSQTWFGDAPQGGIQCSCSCGPESTHTLCTTPWPYTHSKSCPKYLSSTSTWCVSSCIVCTVHTKCLFLQANNNHRKRRLLCLPSILSTWGSLDWIILECLT